MSLINVFHDALNYGLEILGLSDIKLKEKQYEALKAVVLKNRDVLAVLPTGYGKSLIYQLLSLVFDFFTANGSPMRKSTVIVISPLNALMRDQIMKLKEGGLNVCVLKGDRVALTDGDDEVSVPVEILVNTTHTSYANMADHSVVAWNELYESEASWPSVFCFNNASSEKSRFVGDLDGFISLCLRVCHQKGVKSSTGKIVFLVSLFTSEGKTDKGKEFNPIHDHRVNGKSLFATFQARRSKKICNRSQLASGCYYLSMLSLLSLVPTTGAVEVHSLGDTTVIFVLCLIQSG